MCQLCVTPCTATHVPYMGSGRATKSINLGEVSAYHQVRIRCMRAKTSPRFF